MRSASASTPFATQTGAAILPDSYLSATAKWVGLVITTVASGTAAIMRRRERSMRSLRMRALTAGSPSVCCHFFFHFLLAHAVALDEAVALQQIIEHRDHRENGQRRDHDRA